MRRRRISVGRRSRVDNNALSEILVTNNAVAFRSARARARTHTPNRRAAASSYQIFRAQRLIHVFRVVSLRVGERVLAQHAQSGAKNLVRQLDERCGDADSKCALKPDAPGWRAAADASTSVRSRRPPNARQTNVAPLVRRAASQIGRQKRRRRKSKIVPKPTFDVFALRNRCQNIGTAHGQH